MDKKKQACNPTLISRTILQYKKTVLGDLANQVCNASQLAILTCNKKHF